MPVEDENEGGYENRTFTFVDSQEPRAVAVNQLMSDEMQKALHATDGCKTCSNSWEPKMWVSEHFVGILNETEAWGGAYPYLSTSCSVFSVDKKRYLEISDIFVGPEYVELVNQYAAKHFSSLKQQNPDMMEFSRKIRLTEKKFAQQRFWTQSCEWKNGHTVDNFLGHAQRVLDGVDIPWSVLAPKMTAYAKKLLLK